MRLTIGNTVNRKKAFRNVLNALDFKRCLPEQIFQGAWGNFLFFESDRLFAPEFSEVMSEFLRFEKSNLACIINIDETSSFEADEISAVFLDKETTEFNYHEALCGDGSADGWLYSMHRYACASDIGEWCIYCEKINDIAVIGFRNEVDIARFNSSLAKLWAKPIADLIAEGSAPIFPFSHLTPEWGKALTENYQG